MEGFLGEQRHVEVKTLTNYREVSFIKCSDVEV